MRNSIKIVNGKRGFILRVDGMYINNGFGESIKAIQNEIGIPYGATEWVSVKALRAFWNRYMFIIVASTRTPYASVWGQLQLIKK